MCVCVCVLGTYTFDCGCLHVFTFAHVFWPTGVRRCLRSGSEHRVRTVTTNGGRGPNHRGGKGGAE